MQPLQNPDARAARAALQDRQAAHRPDPDHAGTIRECLARARRPDLVADLLARAGEKLRPTTPAPEVNHD